MKRNTKAIVGTTAVVLLVGGCLAAPSDNPAPAPSAATPIVATSEAPAEATPNVPREHAAALKSAQNYIDTMHFSEKGLHEQLTSEYGDDFPKDAADYAMANVQADWNQEALQAAKSYLDIMPMSDAGLHDQLMSEAGDGFTRAQADYALANIPK